MSGAEEERGFVVCLLLSEMRDEGRHRWMGEVAHFGVIALALAFSGPEWSGQSIRVLSWCLLAVL